MAPAWWKSLAWSRDLNTSTENGTDVKYEALSVSPGQTSLRDSEIDGNLRDGNVQRRQSTTGRGGSARLPWIISTIVFGLTTLILLIKISRGPTEVESSCDCPGSSDQLNVNEFGTYKEGFNTELKTALAGLPVDDEQFSGHFVYNASNAQWKAVYRPHEPRWVADPPNSAIDVMWNAVERVRTVYLQGSEADFVREKTTFENGYWVTGLDVIYQLHCLNSLRKALWPEYYHINRSDPIQKMHINHCLDYVRQALMCHADSTPVRSKFFPEAGVFAPDLTVKHTCRDIDGMMKWSLARSKMNGPGSEVPLNQSLVVTEEHPFVDVTEPVHNE